MTASTISGMDGISITDDRKTQVDFSDPYMDNKEYMLVRKGEDRIKQAGDLLTNTDLFIRAPSRAPRASTPPRALLNPHPQGRPDPRRQPHQAVRHLCASGAGPQVR